MLKVTFPFYLRQFAVTELILLLAVSIAITIPGQLQIYPHHYYHNLKEVPQFLF